MTDRDQTESAGGGAVIRLELVIACLALLISLGALVLSLVETRILAAQQRASVWPYVAISPGYGPEGFSIKVQNNGIGPARIKAVSVQVDGKVMTSWPALIKEVLGPDATLDYNTYRVSRINGSVLPANSSHEMFAVPWTPEVRKVVPLLQDSILTICYCSVFDECWVSTLAASARQERCPVKPESQFTG